MKTTLYSVTLLLAGVLFGCSSLEKGTDQPLNVGETSAYQSPEGITPFNRHDYIKRKDSDAACNKDDIRHALLDSTSMVPLTYATAKKCTISEGQWKDTYTDTVFYDAQQVGIIRLVPLSYAHYRGASIWSPIKKQRFASDTENLRVMSKEIALSKGEQGPIQWLPPYRASHCDYLNDAHHVIKKYRLVLNEDEEMEFKEMLERCAQ